MEVLKKLGNNVAELIDLKTIITISVTIAFIYLSVIGTIEPEIFMTVFTMIISFYFGTKNSKNTKGETDE